MNPKDFNREQVEAIIRVLPCLCNYEESVTEIKSIKAISPNDVFAYCWNEGRLKRALRLYGEGKRPKPIDVTGYLINAKVYYIPSDGNHRTLAYRQLGIEKIKAEISSIVTVESYNHLIQKFCYANNPRYELWRYVSANSYKFITNFSELETQLAKQLNVPFFDMSEKKQAN